MAAKLIVGLGNPGRSYARHRHNVGFKVVEALAQRNDIVIKAGGFSAEVGSGKIAEKDVMLMKPLTFMNLSGEAVKMVARYHNILEDQILVVHDDLDLELGRIKFGFQSGHGGHNGIRSIIESLGTNGFYRLRAGIGRPLVGIDPADYVLTSFSSGERPMADELVEKAAQAVEDFIGHDVAYVQQKYH